jgi:hypothetical protein
MFKSLKASLKTALLHARVKPDIRTVMMNLQFHSLMLPSWQDGVSCRYLGQRQCHITGSRRASRASNWCILNLSDLGTNPDEEENSTLP